MAEIAHPEAGPLRQARPAPVFSKTPTTFRRPAPALGADTGAVLAEAGLSEDEIAALAAEGIAGLAPNDDSRR